ncbi:hypothetical protein [Gloeocapsa sp. PCC 73106]|uniref:hypothetical protein n=1 Tax=Gloeocapsa sp. PCC 73106 TaxID=102232 RepID=UPI0002ACFAFE|nr:hypothetical protein [Gloeocapsa sp. PCC 73106]ELR96912.1 hypothetical protein GLO73106DRAFT_00007130 [Gloeocapsa sp. PCC 73106]
MKRDNLFTQVYILDKATNRYMIEIGLDRYTDIFNEWDPAPFKRREIDPDLALYLEECSREIPLSYPVEICFTVPAVIRDPLLEEESRAAFKNCFNFRIYLIKKDVREIRIRILGYLITGFMLLWVGMIFPYQNDDTINWSDILIEGISIGGWVFIWEAISLLFLKNREYRNRLQTYQRLLDAPVIFREAE